NWIGRSEGLQMRFPFAGDTPEGFEDGIEILEQRGGVPVLGVLPYIKDHGMPEEDAVAIEGPEGIAQRDTVDIAVIRLPRISNFDDFDPLASEAGVTVRYVASEAAFGKPNAVILPGTKSTIADMQWLQMRGLDEAVKAAAERGAAVVGICGGYQMLGNTITDMQSVESDLPSIAGMGLVNSETRFRTQKSTQRTKATIRSKIAWLAALNGQTVTGYEIHMGQTTPHSLHDYPHWLHTESRGDGAISADGRIWGCYLHGLFENEAFRRAWLHSLGWKGSNTPQPTFAQRIDRLADHVEAALNMERLMQITGITAPR
ncbi:MAG: cobyric acid synthase, partial [Chloroflexota bacterium]